mmetsp:Transcript_39331/g.58426  ORF Transcript_39331/g.58426 Transcript_39331/m.58426 type:complete len:165 (-) Transcript_39331:623-1117(-)
MNWTKAFLETEELPVSRQGKHQRRTSSILRDEDACARIVKWLKAAPSNKRTPDNLTKWTNEELSPSLTGYETKIAKVRSIQRHMNVLGYKYGVWQKNVYMDGHERSDVVKYRQSFLKRMVPRLDSMKWFEGEDMTICVERINMEETEIVLVTHDDDESIFLCKR